MRAAVYHAPGDIRIEERAAPAPGPGEVLVEMRACGVCGSDLMDWYQAPRAPIVLGHEPVGVVVATGAGAGLPAPGTRVFVHHHVPCSSASTAGAATRRCATSSRRRGSSPAASRS